MDKKGYVYIMSCKSNSTLYVGMTNNLRRRVAEHKLHLNHGFSDTYKTEKLVYYEVYELVTDAIIREKQLKKWNREWKNNLISELNSDWKDLSESIGVNEEYLQGVKEAFDEERLW